MAYYEYLWSNEAGGNVEHIAEHGLTPEDWEFVFENFEDEGISNSTGRPIRFGYTRADRHIIVIFEWLDDEQILVLPMTGFDAPERKR